MPDDRKSKMRAQYPEFAGFVDGLRKAFGEPHAVTFGGVRYGKPEMWFRRAQQFQPPIPGVNANGYGDSGVREGKSGFSVRKDRGLRRANAKGGGLPAEEARRAWYVDDDGDEEGREV